jgi:hypothetical protein
MKAINYLYYKLYKSLEKSSVSDISVYAAAAFLSTLILINILTVNVLLAKLDIIPFIFKNTTQAGVWTFVLMLLSFLFFYRKGRYKRILLKYSNESEEERVKGNFWLAVYVFGSFILFLSMAFYRPGYLPCL